MQEQTAATEEGGATKEKNSKKAGARGQENEAATATPVVHKAVSYDARR